MSVFPQNLKREHYFVQKWHHLVFSYVFLVFYRNKLGISRQNRDEYWVNSDKIKCILSRKSREIQWKRYFSSFRDFSGGFECVLVQMLLIPTLFGVLFYIRRKVILSSIG